VVDLDKNIDINDVTPNCRVALRNDSYTLHKILPNKVSTVTMTITIHGMMLSTDYWFVFLPYPVISKESRKV